MQLAEGLAEGLAEDLAEDLAEGLAEDLPMVPQGNGEIRNLVAYLPCGRKTTPER